MKQEYKEMQERILPGRERQEEMWEKIVKESAEYEKQKQGKYLKTGVIGSVTAALLVCALFLPQIGLADRVKKIVQSEFAKSSDVTKEVQKDIFSDKDQHVKMQVKELLSDGACVYLGVSYRALDQKGREFLSGLEWRASEKEEEVLSIMPYLTSDKHLENSYGCSFYLNEIEKLATDDERYFTYYLFEDADSFPLEDGEMALRYAMLGGFKEKKIAVKSNLDQIVYRVEKRDAAQEEYQPLYLSVSKLSFRLLVQRDVFRELEDDEDPPMVVFTTKDGLERYGSSFADVPKDNSPMMKLADDPGNERKYGIISDVFYEDNHDKWHASPKAMIDHPDQIESIEINGVQYDLVREE